MKQKAKLRMTKQRMVIMDELRKMHNHPTADEIYTKVRVRLPNISLGTVYRNLDYFVSSGAVLKLEYGESTRRFDAVTTPHQHIRCLRCGYIADVDQCLVPEHLQFVTVPNFTVTAARIDFDGVCHECLSKEQQCRLAGC